MAREFYDMAKTVSYNAPMTLIVTQRSYGKTFGILKECVKDWIKSKSEFVYVRRYVSELDLVKGKLFDDLIAHDVFPEYDLRTIGNVAQIKKRNSKKWNTFGYLVSLSQQNSYKSIPYPKVKKIVYEEFVRETKTPPGYLRDEVGTFLNLFKTISRDRENVHAYLLGNACDLTCPYFAFAGIYDAPPVGYSWHNNKSVLMHYPRDAKFEAEERETVVGRLVAGTPYEDVMINNQFAADNDLFIGVKTKNAKPQYGFTFRDMSFCVWSDLSEGKYYINGKIPNGTQTYALTAADMRPNYLIIEQATPFARNLLRLYGMGVLLFDNALRREKFINMLGLIGIR